VDVVEVGTPGAGDAERLRKAAHRQALNMAAASTPGHEDANLMTAAISFFVLLGTIGYWMFLRSKAEKPEAKKNREKNEEELRKMAKEGNTQAEKPEDTKKNREKNEEELRKMAKEGNTHHVARLIKAGTDVGSKDWKQMTALMWACEKQEWQFC